jgi:ribosomal protein L27
MANWADVREGDGPILRSRSTQTYPGQQVTHGATHTMQTATRTMRSQISPEIATASTQTGDGPILRTRSTQTPHGQQVTHGVTHTMQTATRTMRSQISPEIATASTQTTEATEDTGFADIQAQNNPVFADTQSTTQSTTVFETTQSNPVFETTQSFEDPVFEDTGFADIHNPGPVFTGPGNHDADHVQLNMNLRIMNLELQMANLHATMCAILHEMQSRQ